MVLEIEIKNNEVEKNRKDGVNIQHCKQSRYVQSTPTNLMEKTKKKER